MKNHLEFNAKIIYEKDKYGDWTIDVHNLEHPELNEGPLYITFEQDLEILNKLANE